MKKCVFCKSERDLFSLEMTHLEEEYGRFDRKVCGKCWETVFELALKATKKVIEDLENQTEGDLEILQPRTPDERAKLDVTRLVFHGFQKVVSEKDNLTISSTGRPYVYMHQIREATNSLIDDKRDKLTPQNVGNTLRNLLKLEIGKRHGNGVPVFVDNKKIERLNNLIKKE